MRLVFSFFMLALISVVVAGCELTSTKPLLDASKAEPAFGDSFVAVYVQDDGGYLNADGKPSALQAKAQGNIYDIVGEVAGTQIRFYPAGHLPFDYIIELVDPKKTTYAAARKVPTGLKVATIDLSDDVLSLLERRGYKPEKKGNGYTVSSREELMAAIEVWAVQLDRKDDSRFALNYEIAVDDEATGLMVRALTASCLASAGHPLDPDVQRLPGKFARGVALASINIETARQICSWGVDKAASASVRYALSRIHVQAKEYDKAAAITSDLLARDFALAHVMQADQLLRGLGVKQDHAAARKILTDAAPRHPVVAYFLAFMLANGSFGSPDPAAARPLYEAAAAAGIAPAKTGLGLLYAAGAGVTKDEARAFTLFREAARAGDGQGQLESGRALYFGIGTPEDRTAAFVDLQAAAEAGFAEAQYIAGFMLARGQGTEKKEAKAIEYLKKASDAGFLSAKAELGWLTYNGAGITADRKQGKKLLEEAAAAGSQSAKDYLAQLGGNAMPEPGPGVPPELHADIRTLGGDAPFQLNRVNLQFMAGMAQYLTETCGLPSDMGDRLELAGLAMNGASTLMGGNDYSNPDLGKALGNMMGSTGLLIAGAKFAEQMGCDSAAAEHVATRLAEASRSNKGGADSPFIPSCSRAFDETRCACLAQLGRGVMPDIYQQTYHRGIIKEIISRNPLMALTISLTCQIGNY